MVLRRYGLASGCLVGFYLDFWRWGRWQLVAWSTAVIALVLILFVVVLPWVRGRGHLAALGAFIDSRRADSRRRNWVTPLVVILPLTAYAWTLYVMHEPGDIRFYEICAQVLPILMLALIFQSRTLRPGSSKQLQFEDVVAQLTLISVGEVAALQALFHGRGSAASAAMVAGAVACALTHLLVWMFTADAKGSGAADGHEPPGGG